MQQYATNVIVIGGSIWSQIFSHFCKKKYVLMQKDLCHCSQKILPPENLVCGNHLKVFANDQTNTMLDYTVAAYTEFAGQHI